jgi:hypothetical protein
MKNKTILKRRIFIDYSCIIFSTILLFTLNPISLATSKEVTNQNVQNTKKIKTKDSSEVLQTDYSLLKSSLDFDNFFVNFSKNITPWVDLHKSKKMHGIDYIGYSNVNESNFSDDSSLNNFSNDSYVSATSGNPDLARRRYWALVLIFIPLCTIVGNILVVISVVKEKNLHTVTNYFVVSLAIADLAVASTVMPFAVYYEVSCFSRS